MAARLWHKAPFVRLLAALAGGVVLQWYGQFPLTALLLCFACCLSSLLLYSVLPLRWRYRLRVSNGLALLLLLVALGGISVWLHDTRNNPLWFGNTYRNGDFVQVILEEPLVEKTASYKALATVHSLRTKAGERKTEGRIILYFKKDSALPPLQYGSLVVFQQNLQPIKNAGNPGSFDYQTYSLFQGITHQVYLAPSDFVVLPATRQDRVQAFIYNSRSWVVSTLQRFIHGEKEQGLAEALLIGYKDDLDKNLVQAYSNTGVVHIIAISGLHLGLIYWLLLLLTKPLKHVRKLRWLRLLLIISSLWLFSILAGGGPSVLRSALMFTLIAGSEMALRKTNIINTLAFSAFALLCINPFWLWDVGFQLSYGAVLSIVLFFQPIYNWLQFHNRMVDFVWKLTAVTIAAQILTLPISIYHFHQMPLLFLLTNFIAVPLSSLILMGEILLCALFFLPALAGFTGLLLKAGIAFMNSYIEGLDRLPFSTWNFLSINLVQAILLLVFFLAFCYWLMEKQRRQAWIAFSSLAVFMLIRGHSFFDAYRQKKLIVYNVPKHPAMDIIDGRSFAFWGDSSLLLDGFERNFHLQPSRVMHRISPATTAALQKAFVLGGKRVLVLDEAMAVPDSATRQTIDVVILSKNPKLFMADLARSFQIGKVVIDGSVPPWKATLWKKDCDSLQIPCSNVSEDGAFVMNW
ncbi:ComEC/Rec2 family competence protein [Flavisolibacter nicotianae]|uniref:ComEC/Rec2 family competence protein n=1 Tax=Flavisolibacter nicotianae TaxID=2364882 RepID=UPI000EB301B1|nr:ComEC/Rec2 family competence protein [Flavisolibacter nicotianae]